MREIKFRAWHKRNKYLTPSFSIWKVNLFDDPDAHEGNWILMQFTGLHDKNGKEVWEGDILEHDLWGRTQIIWELGMFRGTNSTKGHDITLAHHQLKRCRVIGNIYKNPELLGDTLGVEKSELDADHHTERTRSGETGSR